MRHGVLDRLIQAWLAARCTKTSLVRTRVSPSSVQSDISPSTMMP